MISTPISFTFNNRTTTDFGVARAYVSGLPKYTVGINKENQIEKVLGIDKAFYYGDSNGLFTFELQIFKDGTTHFTIEERLAIRKWFELDRFADLIFAGDYIGDGHEDIVYDCKLEGASDSIDFGGLYGMALYFTSILPYPTTRTTTQYFDLTDNTTTTNIDVFNYGNMPNVFFKDISLRIALQDTNTDVKLENLNYGGYTTEFTGLTVDDIIIIQSYKDNIYLENNETENILPNYTFSDDFQGFFGTISGKNRIKVTGECTIEITGRYPLSI